MRHFFLFLILIINLPTLQSKNIDSLINTLDLLEGENKIDILTQLSWELKYIDQKKAIQYGLEGLSLAQTYFDKEKEAELLKNIAIGYHLKSDYILSEKYSTQAIHLFQKQKNTVGIAAIANILGLTYSNQGHFEKALKSFKKSITLYDAIGDSTKIIAVEANIGNVYLRKGEYQKAIPLYERIVANARQEKDLHKLGLNIFNLGMVHTKLGNYPQALNYLYEASGIQASLDNHLHWVKTQNEIGLIFRRLEMVDEAILLYLPAIEKATALDNQSLVASLSINLGLCFFHKDQYEKALKSFEMGLKIRQDLGVVNVGHILNNIGRSYHALGKDELALNFFNQAMETNSRLNLENNKALDWSNLGKFNFNKGNYSLSEKQLLNAFKIFQKTKELRELVTVTQHLSLLYNNSNQPEQATQFEKLQQEYSNQLYSKEKILAASRIIVREQLKEKNNQFNQSKDVIAHFENEKNTVKKNNQLLWWILISFLSFSIIGFFYFRNKENVKQQMLTKNLAHIELEKKELLNSLEKQNQELILFSLEMVQNKELLKSLKIHISSLAKKYPHNSEIKNILNKLSINDIITKDWSYFNEVFNIAFPNFTKNIRKTYPNLSRKELQHCALIKLNISSAEAANIMGITTESVHTARYRLRKKFNLTRQESLEDLILNF